MSDKMRRLPRHVDGRLKIGSMYWKSFCFKFLPIVIILAVMFFSNPSPELFFLCIILGIIAFAAFSEFSRKETGLYQLKEWIRYKKSGTIYYERSTKNVQSNYYTRYTRTQNINKKQKVSNEGDV